MELVAHTLTDNRALRRWLKACGAEWARTLDSDNDSPEVVVEGAGRCCYWSYAKGRPTDAWFANVIGEGHLSVLEHCSFTFAVAGVSRALSHELVRHRHLSPSQLSQRYVHQSDESVGLGLIVPPAMLEWHAEWAKYRNGQTIDGNAMRFEEWRRACQKSLSEYRVAVAHGLSSGLPRKQAHESARSLLPAAAETRLFITGSGRAWLEALPKRLSAGADAEIQRLFRVFADKLKAAAPHIFAGIGEDA